MRKRSQANTRKSGHAYLVKECEPDDRQPLDIQHFLARPFFFRVFIRAAKLYISIRFLHEQLLRTKFGDMNMVYVACRSHCGG